MISRRRKTAGWIVWVAAGLWILPTQSLAREPAKKSQGAAHGQTAKAPAQRKSSARRASSRRRSRRSNYRYRLARLQPEPERIGEIQQALIREGYLAQEPTGKWDDATRAAMLRYQEANGFAATGLPEAKCLMKLGLGPHPLPEDVDPHAAARARLDASPTSTPPTDPAPVETPPKKNSPD